MILPRPPASIVVTSGVLAVARVFGPVESVPEKDRAGLRFMFRLGALSSVLGNFLGIFAIQYTLR